MSAGASGVSADGDGARQVIALVGRRPAVDFSVGKNPLKPLISLPMRTRRNRPGKMMPARTGQGWLLATTQRQSPETAVLRQGFQRLS